MAVLRLPVRVDPPSYIMTIELEGLFYDFGFRFNPRDAHWFVDIDYNSARALSGIKVVNSEDLFSQFNYLKADNRLPPGTFLVRDLKGLDRDPGREDFGDDVLFLYDEAA